MASPARSLARGVVTAGPTVAPGLLVIRVAAIAALGASGALLAEHQGAFPTYCSPGSGCAELQSSGWAHVPIGPGDGAPVAAVGIAGFALLLATTLRPAVTRWRQLAALGAIAAGVVGVALVVLQGAVLGRYCRLCVAVDTAAMVAAVGGGGLWVGWPAAGRERLRPGAWAALGALAGLVPGLWPVVRAVPEAPPEIRALHRSGRINVVVLVDFTCPHCRELAARLDALDVEYGERVRVECLAVAFGPGSDAAARAYVCAEAQGRGRRMAESLLRASDLDPTALRRLAGTRGLDLATYDLCIAAASTGARLDAGARILLDAGYEGLPTLYVGNRKMVGVPTLNALRVAYDEAADGADRRGISLRVYVGFVVAATLAILVSGARWSR